MKGKETRKEPKEAKKKRNASFRIFPIILGLNSKEPIIIAGTRIQVRCF